MSYIRTIAWGMLDVDELEADERVKVLDKLHYELRLHGFAMSSWPMGRRVDKISRRNKRGRIAQALTKADVAYSIRYRTEPTYTGTLRECCHYALHNIEPSNHDTHGGNDA